eukprot:12907026-Prorocentrum_lima.AAC.1
MDSNQDSSQLLSGRAAMLHRITKGGRVSSEERQRGGRLPHAQSMGLAAPSSSDPSPTATPTAPWGTSTSSRNPET